MYGPDDTSAIPARPAPAAAGTLGWFGSGNPATGVLPTLVQTDFLNGLVAEMLSVLGAAQIVPSKAAVDQLLQAIRVVAQQVGDGRYAPVGSGSGGSTPAPSNGFGTQTSIASAATTDLGTIATRNALVTGSTTVTSLGGSASLSTPVFLSQFQNGLTLKQGANLQLPQAADLVVGASDFALFLYTGGSSWRCILHIPASGILAAAKAYADAGDALHVPLAGYVAMTGPLPLPAPPPFTRDTRAARMQDTLNGGAHQALVGLTTPRVLLATEICGFVTVTQSAGTWTLPLASSVPTGTRADFHVRLSGFVLSRQGTDVIGIPEGVASTYAPSLGTNFSLESDSATTWYVVSEANLYAPQFRGAAGGITAPRAQAGTALATLDYARTLGRRFATQVVVSGGTTLAADACGVALVVTSAGVLTLPGNALTAGDTISVTGATGGITVSAPAGLVLYQQGVGPTGSLALPPGWWLEAYYDGGGAWIVRDYGSATGSSKLQTLSGYPITIAAGTTSYDLTWTAGLYDRLLLTGKGMSSTAGINVTATRDGSGAWTALTGTALASPGTDGYVVVNGGNLGVSAFIGLTGTGYPATHAGGLSGIRLAPSSGTFSSAANGVVLSGS